MRYLLVAASLLFSTAYAQNYPQLLQQSAQGKNWDAYLQTALDYTEQLMANQQNAEAAQIAEQSLALLEKQPVADAKSLSQLNKNAAFAYYALADDGKVLYFLQKTLSINEKLSPNAPELAKDYANVGQLQNKLQQPKMAVKNLQKAADLSQKLNDKALQAYIYSELCLAYANTDDIKNALQRADLAVLTAEEATGNKSVEYGLALLNKGTVLQLANMPQEAISSLQKAKKVFLNAQPTDYTNYHICLGQIGATFQKLYAEDKSKGNFLDSAAWYFAQNLSFDKSYNLGNNFHLLDNNMSLAGVELGRNNPNNAKKYLDAANVFGNLLPAKSIKKSELYKLFGIQQLSIGDYAAAQGSFQQQINALILDFDRAGLPTEADFGNCIALSQLTGALGWKVRTHYLAYQNSKQIEELKQAYQIALLGDKLVDYIRHNESGSKSFVSAFSLDNYEFAIATCLALYETGKEEIYKNQAFYFSEKSKGLALLEAFQNSKASAIAGVPAELINQEADLRLSIASLEQELFALLPKKSKELLPKINEVQQQIANQKSKYTELVKSIEQKYPQYFQLKYELKLLNVEETRKTLAPEQAILSYFVGEEHIFIFKISQSEFEIKPLKTAEGQTQKQISELRESIYGYHLGLVEKSDASLSALADRYAELSHRLYQDLIAPMSPLPKRLVIIPDGALNYLPFDALLTAKPEDNKEFKSLPYLLLNHSISYSYSATLLQEMQKRQLPANRGNFLAFAPSFGLESAAEIRGKRYNLSPLTYNVPEVRDVAAVLNGGDIYTEKAATEEQFKQLASQYRIIHFATHGMANNDHPDYSLLAFTEISDDKENEYLYVGDLYNMNVNADLVVLSACETGIGKLARGEGVQSLARGFAYAGSKSIFTTLWSVNDQATSKIVTQFYQYLALGKSKDEALQLARIDYIQAGNNSSAHPFLWSPFILIGDSSPMEGIVSTAAWVWYGAAALGILSLGAGFAFLKRRNIKAEKSGWV